MGAADAFDQGDFIFLYDFPAKGDHGFGVDLPALPGGGDIGGKRRLEAPR